MISEPQTTKVKMPVKVEFVGILPTLFSHCENCMETMHGRVWSLTFSRDDCVPFHFQVSFNMAQSDFRSMVTSGIVLASTWRLD